MVPQGRRGQGPHSGGDMEQEQGSGAGAEKMRCRGAEGRGSLPGRLKQRVSGSHYTLPKSSSGCR